MKNSFKLVGIFKYNVTVFLLRDDLDWVCVELFSNFLLWLKSTTNLGTSFFILSFIILANIIKRKKSETIFFMILFDATMFTNCERQHSYQFLFRSSKQRMYGKVRRSWKLKSINSRAILFTSCQSLVGQIRGQRERTGLNDETIFQDIARMNKVINSLYSSVYDAAVNFTNILSATFSPIFLR